MLHVVLLDKSMLGYFPLHTMYLHHFWYYILTCCEITIVAYGITIEISTPVNPVEFGAIFSVLCKARELTKNHMVSMYRTTEAGGTQLLTSKESVDPEIDERVFLAVRRIDGSEVYFLTITGKLTLLFPKGFGLGGQGWKWSGQVSMRLGIRSQKQRSWGWAFCLHVEVGGGEAGIHHGRQWEMENHNCVGILGMHTFLFKCDVYFQNH